jgi:ubiquinol-cytochrome c reductase core subunit 2
MLIKHPIPKAIAASRQHRAVFARLPSTGSIAHNTVCRRTYAAAAATKTSSSATPFTVSDVGGIRVAARDDGGPTTGLTIVLKAGSRYAPAPGLAHLLDKFAWKVTFSEMD